jgi:hypothetical protein
MAARGEGFLDVSDRNGRRSADGSIISRQVDADVVGMMTSVTSTSIGPPFERSQGAKPVGDCDDLITGSVEELRVMCEWRGRPRRS